MIDLNSQEFNKKELISREAILSTYSSFELFKFYLPELNPPRLISSPLRKEKNASFGIFKNKETNEWMFKDFGGESGDIFKLISLLYFNGDYFKAICKVAIDLHLDDIYYCPLDNYQPLFIPKLERTEEVVNNEKIFTLDVKIRKFESYDLIYWNQFYIGKDTLEKYNVFPISKYYINKDSDIPMVFNADKFAYVYLEKKDGVLTKKIYQPFNKRRKFINTHKYSVHDGYRQLPGVGDVLIITKSRKDVMSIYQNTPYNTIGIQGETILIKNSVIEEYKRRFNTVVTLFDNDEAGYKLAKKYKERYNIRSIFIPEKSGVKDFSDYIKKYKKIKARNLLIKLIKHDTITPTS